MAVFATHLVAGYALFAGAACQIGKEKSTGFSSAFLVWLGISGCRIVVIAVCLLGAFPSGLCQQAGSQLLTLKVQRL
jgi:hypothetical protein